MHRTICMREMMYAGLFLHPTSKCHELSYVVTEDASCMGLWEVPRGRFGGKDKDDTIYTTGKKREREREVTYILL